MKKIAIVGTGISGLSCAYLLGREHSVSLFEANDYIGGHTATIDVNIDARDYAIDTGFIVFNDRTYPNFIALMNRAKVAMQPTEMSFSVHNCATGLEYNGRSLSTLFAQPSNLLKPHFYKFLWDIVRFNKLAKAALADERFSDEDTLGDFLDRHGFSDFFAEHYLLAMVAAIWSASIADSRAFSLAFFLRFFNNHGLLDLANRPQWYVLKGGSRSYIPELTSTVDDIRLNTPVTGVRRTDAGVYIQHAGNEEFFNEVIFACHSDQALALLADPSDDEQLVLGAIPYRDNDVVLHTDTSLLPRRKKAWASWNYALNRSDSAVPAVTYDMNILQGLTDTDITFCVSLNQTDAIAPDKILRRFSYAHPVMNTDVLKAQQQRHRINAKQHSYFCGAYWYNGFHEDGVKSALDVCRYFDVSL